MSVAKGREIDAAPHMAGGPAADYRAGDRGARWSARAWLLNIDPHNLPASKAGGL